MSDPTTRRFPFPKAGSPYFLTGVTNAAVEAEATRFPLGLLATPNGGASAAIPRWVEAGAPWAADNGCFTQGENFDPDRWLRWLAERDRTNVLFAVLPDVVGDPVATLERSLPYVDRVRALGYPVALAGQDGLTPEDVPWSKVDSIFIGGSTDWKLSEESARLMRAARSLRRWVHVGRVNSGKRYRWAAENGAHSVDGTFLGFGPVKNLPRLLSWLEPFEAPADEPELDLAA